jgi:hypothetical protein
VGYTSGVPNMNKDFGLRFDLQYHKKKNYWQHQPLGDDVKQEVSYSGDQNFIWYSHSKMGWQVFWGETYIYSMTKGFFSLVYTLGKWKLMFTHTNYIYVKNGQRPRKTETTKMDSRRRVL